MEFTDRYQALGIPYPDPSTMCLGQCEGTGMYPQKREWSEECVPSARWEEAHREGCSLSGRLLRLWHAIRGFDRIYLRMTFERCDGWHFIKCEQCGGTGKRLDG